MRAVLVILVASAANAFLDGGPDPLLDEESQVPRTFSYYAAEEDLGEKYNLLPGVDDVERISTKHKKKSLSNAVDETEYVSRVMEEVFLDSLSRESYKCENTAHSALTVLCSVWAKEYLENIDKLLEKRTDLKLSRRFIIRSVVHHLKKDCKHLERGGCSKLLTDYIHQCFCAINNTLSLMSRLKLAENVKHKILFATLVHQLFTETDTSAAGGPIKKTFNPQPQSTVPSYKQNKGIVHFHPNKSGQNLKEVTPYNPIKVLPLLLMSPIDAGMTNKQANMKRVETGAFYGKRPVTQSDSNRQPVVNTIEEISVPHSIRTNGMVPLSYQDYQANVGNMLRDNQNNFNPPQNTYSVSRMKDAALSLSSNKKEDISGKTDFLSILGWPLRWRTYSDGTTYLNGKIDRGIRRNKNYYNQFDDIVNFKNRAAAEAFYRYLSDLGLVFPVHRSSISQPFAHKVAAYDDFEWKTMTGPEYGVSVDQEMNQVEKQDERDKKITGPVNGVSVDEEMNQVKKRGDDRHKKFEVANTSKVSNQEGRDGRNNPAYSDSSVAKTIATEEKKNLKFPSLEEHARHNDEDKKTDLKDESISENHNKSESSDSQRGNEEDFNCIDVTHKTSEYDPVSKVNTKILIFDNLEIQIGKSNELHVVDLETGKKYICSENSLEASLESARIIKSLIERNAQNTKSNEKLSQTLVTYDNNVDSFTETPLSLVDIIMSVTTGLQVPKKNCSFFRN